MDPKWCAPEPGENNKRTIDGAPYTRNTATNRQDKDATPGTGAIGHLATIPPAAQGGWTPPTAPPTAPIGPSTADPKGGVFLAGVHATIKQQYLPMGFHRQPTPSQLAAFNAAAATNATSAATARKDEINHQIDALSLEHKSLN